MNCIFKEENAGLPMPLSWFEHGGEHSNVHRVSNSCRKGEHFCRIQKFYVAKRQKSRTSTFFCYSYWKFVWHRCRLVLYDISIHRIDINCELKIDYTSIDIDIELVYRPSRIVISDIEHHFDELYEKRIVYWKIKFKRADIESNPKNWQCAAQV